LAVLNITLMTESSQTVLVSIRYSGAEMPCIIGPSVDTTLATVRSVALHSFGIPENAAGSCKLFVDAVELVDLGETVGHLAAGETLIRLDLGSAPNAAPRNPLFELTQAQIERIAQIESDAAELHRQMERTGVDLNIAQLTGELDDASTTRTRNGNAHVVEQCYVVDETKEAAAMRALRQLPDGAGNEAFLAVYNANGHR
jgi:hypothetical protein